MRVVPLLVLTFAALPLLAQSNEVAVWAGRSSVGKTSIEGSDIHFDNGDAFGLSFTHFFSNHYAADVAVFDLRHNGAIRVQGVNALDIGRLTMTPVVGTLQWHAEHTHRIDPYVGAGLAWTRSSSLHSADLDNAAVGRVSVQNRIGFTAVGGVSFAFMKQLAVAGEARYIGYHPDSGPSNARVRLDLSPLVYSLGLRWRF